MSLQFSRARRRDSSTERPLPECRKERWIEGKRRRLGVEGSRQRRATPPPRGPWGARQGGGCGGWVGSRVVPPRPPYSRSYRLCRSPPPPPACCALPQELLAVGHPPTASLHSPASATPGGGAAPSGRPCCKFLCSQTHVSPLSNNALPQELLVVGQLDDQRHLEGILRWQGGAGRGRGSGVRWVVS